MVESLLAHAKILKNFLTPEGLFLDVGAKALIGKSCLLIFSIFVSGPLHCIAGRTVWRKETISEVMKQRTGKNLPFFRYYLIPVCKAGPCKIVDRKKG
jgi:hypothetical protein